tara:strand:+ start:272 stop:736 length:465 start_codon:yes stop_codon:yes gene_type:complete
MATFAEIDNDNIVLRIIKVDDAEAPNPNTGEQYCNTLFGGNWRQCSYNTSGNVHGEGGTPFRKNMPAIGWIWDSEKNGFVEPQPYDSWTLNDDTCLWDPPIARPSTQDAGGVFVYGNTWIEATQRWEATEYDNNDIPTSNKFYWNPSTSAWVAI